MFELPKINWFIQNGCVLNNVYSSCVGTDSAKGFMNKTTFNYKIFAEDSQNGQALHVECFLCFPWNCSERTGEFVEKDFEASLQGIDDAKVWLAEEFAKNSV